MFNVMVFCVKDSFLVFGDMDVFLLVVKGIFRFVLVECLYVLKDNVFEFRF